MAGTSPGWGPGSRAQGLSSCSSRAQLLPWQVHLPRSGMKPMCPTEAGGSLATEPPGKPPGICIFGTFRKQQLCMVRVLLCSHTLVSVLKEQVLYPSVIDKKVDHVYLECIINQLSLYTINNIFTQSYKSQCLCAPVKPLVASS